MSHNISRRIFLRYLVAGASAVSLETLLSACNQNTTSTSGESTLSVESTDTVTPGPTTVPHPTANLTGTKTESVPESTTVSTPVVPIAKNGSLVVTRKGEPEPLVRRAIEALGGMQQFVHSGNRVVIKPNICVAYNTYEYASTTNPWVVGTLVKMCFEVGAGKVLVLDFPFGGESKDAYVKSGIQEQVLAAGGEMQAISPMKFKGTDVPAGKDLKSISVYDEILNADVVINVPIAKHHGDARLTLGMKNLMGVIEDRGSIHFNLGQRIADLTSRLYPTLTVIDAVRILVRNGPTGGNLQDVKKIDTVIASTDIVAADSYATSLFDMKPSDLEYIVDASAMNLGESDLSKVKIEEITVAG